MHGGGSVPQGQKGGTGCRCRPKACTRLHPDLAMDFDALCLRAMNIGDLSELDRWEKDQVLSTFYELICRYQKEHDRSVLTAMAKINAWAAEKNLEMAAEIQETVRFAGYSPVILDRSRISGSFASARSFAAG